MGKTDVESNWWRPMAVVVLLIPLSFTFGLIYLWDGFIVLTVPVMLLGIYGMFGSLVGYYRDAKNIKETEGVDWEPWWWLYLLGHILFSPLLTAPVYLFQRWRHVGVPWSDLFVWRRVTQRS